MYSNNQLIDILKNLIFYKLIAIKNKLIQKIKKSIKKKITFDKDFFKK